MSDRPLSVLGSGTRLAPARGIHLAADRGEVIVLDTARDQYSALGPALSRALQWALNPDSSPEPAGAAALLEPLVHSGLLVPAPPRTAGVTLDEPAEPGGVASYLWTPYLSRAAQSGVRASAFATAKALGTIAAADTVLRHGNIAAVLHWLRTRHTARPARTARPSDTAALVDAHIRARMLYPRQIHCLTGSAALAAHAWAGGHKVAFVIGVQKYPFVAHAWVEHDGHVLNDRADVAARLAPIVSVGRHHEH